MSTATAELADMAHDLEGAPDEAAVINEGAEPNPDEIQLMYDELGIVLKAFADVGANRLPLGTSVALHNHGKPFRTASQEYGELKNAVLAPYVREGERGVRPDHPHIAEISAKLDELGHTVVTIERNGPPVDLTPFLPDESGATPSGVTIACESRYLTVLIGLGVVQVEATE